MPPRGGFLGRLAALAQPGEPLVQRLPRHLGDTERREQLPDDGVGLHLAAFELVDMGADLFVHELAYGVAHGKIDVCPFQHVL